MPALIGVTRGIGRDARSVPHRCCSLSDLEAGVARRAPAAHDRGGGSRGAHRCGSLPGLAMAVAVAALTRNGALASLKQGIGLAYRNWWRTMLTFIVWAILLVILNLVAVILLMLSLQVFGASDVITLSAATPVVFVALRADRPAIPRCHPARRLRRADGAQTGRRSRTPRGQRGASLTHADSSSAQSCSV